MATAGAESTHGAFGEDSFGRLAEKVARFFGTPQYIVGQTIIVACWIAFNTAALGGFLHFDRKPYILLNLIFSTQAAYAAPLILLAQTRQADRDKLAADREDKRHSRTENAIKSETAMLFELLQANTQLTTQDKELTERVEQLAQEMHALICKPGAPATS